MEFKSIDDKLLKNIKKMNSDDSIICTVVYQS